MSDRLLNWLIYALITLPMLIVYIVRWKRKEARVRVSIEKGKLFSEGPKAQHPHIDLPHCIGCGTCVDVCPEGDVLGLVGGKAAIINGHKCIGHGLCVDVCPVGAITLVMASPSVGGDLPALTPEFETSVPDMYIVGELGGLALIKNAVNQGRECIDIIKTRKTRAGLNGNGPPDVFDVCIVGAGPGGISASLRAIEHKLRYITIEQDEIGGTVAKYPRQKLVMTSPVELPLYGKFKKLEISKESLLELWKTIGQRSDFKVNAGEKVEDIQKDQNAIFTIRTTKSQYRAHAVVLALGRMGTPRKLGVKGEELPKVMYSLIEADHYKDCKILVVGGGDSAIEAAMGLGHQSGNSVMLSYRKSCFTRIKERNAKRIQESIDSGKVQVLFDSIPVEFTEKSVFIEVKGEIREIPNDYVWVFAGGTPPNAFLEKVGVQLGSRDMTAEVHSEAVLKENAPKPDPSLALESSLPSLCTRTGQRPHDLPREVTLSE
jgi:thioredoxin reductase/Pyruvate/2-oxoacid:ferredoxin oxidoreductase delta subunit